MDNEVEVIEVDKVTAEVDDNDPSKVTITMRTVITINCPFQNKSEIECNVQQHRLKLEDLHPTIRQ